jgi:type IV pilus assembly protein PilC
MDETTTDTNGSATPPPFAPLTPLGARDQRTAPATAPTSVAAPIPAPPAPPDPAPSSRTERRSAARLARDAEAAAKKDGQLADGATAAERRAAAKAAKAEAAATRKAAAGTRRKAASNERSPKKRTSIGGPKKVKPPTVLAFSRQMSSFLEAGISILEALEIVGEETGTVEMRDVIADMRASIERGGSFSDAVSAHPAVFPAYYRAMVRSAEFTGRLDEVLNQLATYLDRDIAARRQIKSALTYPTIVLCVAVAAMVVMSVFVLPKFATMYRGLGAKLPLPTRMLLSSTDFFTSSWPLIAVGVLVVLLGVKLVFNGAAGKLRRDRFVLRLPVLGNLFHLISLERFCRVLAALSKAGVPLPDAIQMSADSTNNTVFQAKMVDVRDTLVRGGGLAAPIVETGIFPVAARQMIRVGERTGSLSRQLSKAATYYEREVGFAMKKATEMFEPAVIMLVGGLVGFVAVAQVSALYSIFSQVKT